ncbi:MAG: alpha/beta fold hydrolase [Chloroflexi bacterium]|nr:alpha/beta fold hydrolase [Chloroflexota bacterium]
MAGDPRARRIEANGLSFHVTDSGEGPPVVLLHGFPDTSALWRNQIVALVKAGFRCIAPDMRGRGRSDRPDDVADYALTNMVRDVAGVMDALGVDRAHIVGHDWGAAVAWLFASLMPDRTETLTAISVGFPGAGGPPDLEALQKSWYRLLIQFEGIAEEAMRRNDWRLFRELLRQASDIDRYIKELSDPEALTAGLNWYRANLPPESFLRDPRPLPPVQAPTLGIWSTGDDYLTEKPMLASADHVTGSWRYERFEGAGHWIPLDEPERLNRLILEHIS